MSNILEENEKRFQTMFKFMNQGRRDLKISSRKQNQRIEWCNEQERLRAQQKSIQVNLQMLYTQEGFHDIKTLSSELCSARKHQFNHLVRNREHLVSELQPLEGQKKELEEYIKTSIRELQRGENENRAHQKTMSFEGLPQLRDRDEALKNLVQATNRRLERIDGDYQQDINDIDVTQVQKEIEDLCWNEADETRFSYLCSQLRRMISIDSNTFVSRIIEELPHIKKTVVLKRVGLHRKLELLRMKRRDRRLLWKRIRCEEVESAEQALQQLLLELKMQESKEKNLQAFEKRKERISKELKLLRFESRIKAETEERQRIEETTVLERKERARTERKRFERQRQKRELLCYKEVKEAQQWIEQQEMEENRILCLRRKEIEARRNAERVSFRQKCDMEKSNQRRIHEKEETLREQKKQERLQAIRDQVRINVRRDPKRLFSETASRLNEKAYVGKQHLFPIHGYDQEQVWADERFRVTHALRENELHTSAYAVSAVLNANTRTVPRSDMFQTY